MRIEDQKILEQKLKLIRGKGEYDCLVGISGGKDSAYVAYQLKNRYGLKVLTYTNDNGFLTDCARENISLIVEKLHLEHRYVKIPMKMLKYFYRWSLLHCGWPCEACIRVSRVIGSKIVLENNIPLFVKGHTPYQMFNKVIPLKNNSIWERFPEELIGRRTRKQERETFKKVLVESKRIFQETARKMQDESKKFCNAFLVDEESCEKTTPCPEYLNYFLYEKYNENQIKRFLTKKLGFILPDDSRILQHSDCLIHDAAKYMQFEVLGYSSLAQELSVMIREGTINREDAFARIKEEKHLFETPIESLNMFSKRCEISMKEIKRFIFYAKMRHSLKRFLINYFRLQF
ncbi:MAG: hypothetical protein KKB82_07575 [Candidatus Omnitrophica bacterium]|nr:hypothetical protein [Candidatus Omnitrophota bacterium]MBU1925761.1 hypothetical protein [Candidatus Omnitrophota bacterium]